MAKPRKQLTPVANPSAKTPVRSEYHEALADLELELNDLLSQTHTLALFSAGFGVHREVRRLASSRSNDIPEGDLTDILKATQRIVAGNVAHPRGDAGYLKEIDTYYELINRIKRFPLGELLSSAMLWLLGISIIVASGLLALVSFGILAPISILGTLIGESMIIGGIATGACGIVGAGTLMKSGITLFKAVQTNPLRHEMMQTEAAASVYYTA